MADPEDEKLPVIVDPHLNELEPVEDKGPGPIWRPLQGWLTRQQEQTRRSVLEERAKTIAAGRQVVDEITAVERAKKEHALAAADRSTVQLDIDAMRARKEAELAKAKQSASLEQDLARETAKAAIAKAKDEQAEHKERAKQRSAPRASQPSAIDHHLRSLFDVIKDLDELDRKRDAVMELFPEQQDTIDMVYEDVRERILGR